MANKDNSKDKNLICNFCGKSQDEVERMIIGPGVNICNECIELCHSLLDEEGKAPAQAPRRGKAAPAHAAPQDINILTPAGSRKVWTSMSSGRTMPRWYWLFLCTTTISVS